MILLRLNGEPGCGVPKQPEGVRKKFFMFFLRMKRPVFLFILAAVFCLTLPKDARAKRYQVSARAAIFSNSTKVVRYYGKNVHKQVLPASTTKVMTALLVMERLPLDKVVTVSKRATRAQPSKIYAKPGEKFKVRDLLYAILLKSANDASIVLAEAVAGSEAKFVQLMNRRAREINAHHTHFANSNGLPTKARQYTTPYDMYLIFRRAIRHKFFRDAIRLKYKTIYSTAGRKIKLRSHNKILFFDGWKRKLYGKTGYTRAAKACFVGYLDKNGDTCIIAVFGCTHRWSDIKYIVSKYGGIDI